MATSGRRLLTTTLLLLAGALPARGMNVSGRVQMPELCSPAVSPAVVRLEPVNASKPLEATGPATVRLVDQRGIRFEPRIVAMRKGETLRFGNADPTVHNVHIVASGVGFNQSVATGATADFIPSQSGILKVVCDIHSHMRAYVVVGTSPWVASCGRTGEFQFRDVPAGRYRLMIWHEMGAPLTRPLDVRETDLDLGTVVVTTGPNPVTEDDQASVCETGCEPWPLVIDRIAMTLASSLDAAQRPELAGKALPLAQDAYHRDFESSGLRAAIRVHLGQERATQIEDLFGDINRTTVDVVEKRAGTPQILRPTRQAILRLAQVSEALNQKGVTERSKIFERTSPAFFVEETPAEGSGQKAEMKRLAEAFDRVKALAEVGQPAAATAALGDASALTFGPLKRDLFVRGPGSMPPIQARFNALRGRIGAGLRGQSLATELDDLRAEIGAIVDDADVASQSSLPAAMRAALVLVVREGAVVVILLTVLIALMAALGGREAFRPLGVGIGLAIVASVMTLAVQNLTAGAGRGQELREGLIGLATSCVLFHLGIWLIPQVDLRRTGSVLAGLAAFLPAYAALVGTIVMDQALLELHASRAGVIGNAAGLIMGLGLLASFSIVVRRALARLPLRVVSRIALVLLFTVAVVYAGQGVFALQSGRILKTVALGGPGTSLSIVGLYPTIQSVAVQGVLIAGAVVALLLGGSSKVETSSRV